MGNANIKQIQETAKQKGEFQLQALQLTDVPRFSKFKIDFTTITVFNAEDNKLTQVPKDIELLVNLKELNLSKNKLTKFSPPKLPKLEKIDIGFNPVVDVEDNFDVSPNLVNVTCYGCNLTSIPLKSLQNNSTMTIMVNSNYLQISNKHIPVELLPRVLGLNDQKVPSEIIDDFLYLGSVNAAQHWEGLQDRKITDVLCMVSMRSLPFPDKLKYKLVKIDDIETADIKQHFTDINEYLEDVKKNGGRVLVHCAAGVSRSGSAVIAYVMATQNLGYTAALEYVSVRRPCVCPNTGFERQLKEYEILRTQPT